MKIILPALLYTILVSQYSVRSFDLNSIFGRTTCYNNVQPDCNQDFIDAYPHLSKSATNLTDANTYFLLFTRRNKDQPEKLHKCGGKLPPTTHFDPSQELIVIAHPYVSGFCDVAVYREWLFQILQRGDYNVLAVDYSWGNHIDYGTVLLNLKIVAKQTIIVLKNIEERIGSITVTVVGLSLGAQLAGLIGQGFHLKRIIALDPANPGYDANLVPPEERLDKGDADFVEVWSCNSGSCLPYLGTPYNLGHVRFVINGGKFQRSCYKYAFIFVLKGDFIYGFGNILEPNVCSHNHCSQYFKVAINPGNCKFVGVKCDSYSDFKLGKCKCGKDGHNCRVMGFDTGNYVQSNISSPETYYVTTTDTCPYCDNNPFYLGDFSDPYA